MKLWLCNRKRCKYCYEECKHTTQKEFAAYPDITTFKKDENGNEWQWITQVDVGQGSEKEY